MFRMCASNSHSYTHLILALGIVRKPTVWVFITSKYPGTHDIGLANSVLFVFVYEQAGILGTDMASHTELHRALGLRLGGRTTESA